MYKLIGLIIALFFITALNAFAETKAATPAQTNTAVAQNVPVANPNLFFSYNYYHYDLTGQSTATTNIYKFGNSTVDLNMMVGTWLYNSDWTFVGIIPHISNKVETIYEPVVGGINYKTVDTTSGLSDVRLMAVTSFSLNAAHVTMLDIGLTLPTGSIDQYFTSAPNQRAAYNMQPGSGTPDLVLGATVTNTKNALVSSARAQATVRGGRNSNGYVLGNEFLAKASSIYSVNNYFSSGVVANYRIRGAVIGKDEKYEKFNAYQSAVAAGDGHQFYHAPQANWDASLMAKVQSPSYKSVNASLELGLPVAQGAANKDDIQLDVNYYAAASLNASF